jgi:hypothetical protein
MMTAKQRAYGRLIDARRRVNAADLDMAKAAREMTLALDELTGRTDEYLELTGTDDDQG